MSELTTLVCPCCKDKIQADVGGGDWWDRAAALARQKNWVAVVKGEAVGMSEGSHHYACCAEHRDTCLRES